MARTKTDTKGSSKHAEQQDVTDIQNKLYLCVLDFSEEKKLRFLKMNFPRKSLTFFVD